MMASVRAFLVHSLKLAGAFALGSLLLLAGSYAYVHGAGNFHEVRKGVLYRSSCLGAEGLEKAIARHGVRSVLNLCGEQPGEAWYDGEVRVSRRHGVDFRSLPFSAKQELDASQVRNLIALLRDAPKPLLIHCRAGSDRTGLACALYVAACGGSYREACEQLSLYYGHFPFFGSKTVAMDATLDRFFPGLAGQEVVSRSGAR
jgi:protein tyrosine/serine phosphatase